MHDKICYKTNYLKQVIARVDLISPIVSINTQLDPGIINTIRERYPIPEQATQNIQEVKFKITQGKPETPEPSSPKTITEWTFWDKDRQNKLVITYDMILFVFQKYESFDSFESLFTTILNAFSKAYGDIISKRIGLRYINNIEIKGKKIFQWSKYITRLVTPSIITKVGIKEKLSRAFQITEINYGDFSLTFRHGIPNSDYPAPIKRDEFVLDLDAYCTLAQPPEEVIESIHKFHEKIQELFELSITEDLRKIMGNESDTSTK